MRDQQFCECLCRSLGIPIEVIDFDVEEYCQREKVSTEKACRDLRYAHFRKRLQELDYDRIAIAHNQDDQAETLLMNLFRGAGVRGLAGMQVDSGEIVRPLLSVSRAEIIEYLSSINQNYIVDSTNLESDYRRNFVRNEILPLIESRWPAAKRKIAETAEIMREQVKVNSGLAANLNIGDQLSIETIKSAKSAKWAVWEFVDQAGGSREIADEIYASLTNESPIGKWWRIDSNTRIIRERDGLQVVRNKAVAEPEIVITGHLVDESLMSEIKRAPLSELWLPADVEVEVRRWQIGDRIKPLGMTGTQLVSDIIKDAKLTTDQKERIRVAVDKNSGEILWVEGLKRSRLRLVEQGSANKLKIKN
jgi:tRNA(Ile)-lysidine synthase